jgi:hypothetical protein
MANTEILSTTARNALANNRNLWPSEAAAIQPLDAVCLFECLFSLHFNPSAAMSRDGFSVGLCFGLVIMLPVVLIPLFLVRS